MSVEIRLTPSALLRSDWGPRSCSDIVGTEVYTFVYFSCSLIEERSVTVGYSQWVRVDDPYGCGSVPGYGPTNQDTGREEVTEVGGRGVTGGR